MLTRTGAGAVIVTRLVSARPAEWVPMTWYVPETVPAVYRPLELMLPPVADHVTGGGSVLPLLQVPDAVNCWVPPGATEAEAGEMVSEVRSAELTVTSLVSALP